LLNSAPRKMDASSNLLNVASSTASSAVTGQNWPPDEVTAGCRVEAVGLLTTDYHH